MAVLSVLLGFVPARVDNCRVLELGCGEGANLIALAYALPNSRFEGVDLSRSSIDRACAYASRVGVSNAVFRVEDLAEFPADRGEYDYIIAHGLYSWVPARVREKMFEICSRHLAPSGLAYISYNALPGGYFRRYPRDITRFRIRSLSDPAERIREARAVLTSVLESLSENSVEATVIQNELTFSANSDGFLYHDLLADESEPIYFLDFMDGAARHGLQFVAEADLKQLFPPALPQSASLQLQRITDRVEREQYLDFVRCRLFRQTVLCRKGCELHFDPSPDRFRRLLIGTPTRPAVAIENLHDSQELEFHTPFGTRVTCTEAVPKALFWVLGEIWPKALTYDELKQEVFRRVGFELDAENDLKFAAVMCRCYASGFLNLHYFQPLLCPTASERPVASAVARSWPEIEVAVPSLHLSAVAIDQNLISLLRLLDGTRDRQQLAAELGAQFGRDVPPAELERSLTRIAECGLLLA